MLSHMMWWWRYFVDMGKRTVVDCIILSLERGFLWFLYQSPLRQAWGTALSIRLLLCLRSIKFPTTESQTSLFCCPKNTKGVLSHHPNYRPGFLEGRLGLQMLLKQWFSTGADFVPHGYLAMSGDHLRWGMLLISSEWRLGQPHNKECQ